MQYSRLLALLALLASTAMALPHPQEEAPEDSDNPTDIPNPAEAGHPAGEDTDSSSSQSPDGLAPTSVNCDSKGSGTHQGADIQTLLNGWYLYSNITNQSGGPYLSGAMSTVFHTAEYDWTEYGGKGDKEGHEYCDSCFVTAINAGASHISCNIQPGGFYVASFTDTMSLGTKP